MSKNYAILTDRNKAIVDSFMNDLLPCGVSYGRGTLLILIDFLAARQKEHEKELLDAIRECEKGDCAGPFHSVEELMADLDT